MEVGLKAVSQKPAIYNRMIFHLDISCRQASTRIISLICRKCCFFFERSKSKECILLERSLFIKNKKRRQFKKVEHAGLTAEVKLTGIIS